jgi:uncharacterized protein YndB with AHSA1/START domain
MTTPQTYRFADGPTTEVEAFVAAPPARVWELITDINLAADFSAEFLGATWLDGAEGPVLGARFAGRNTRLGREWTVPSTIVSCEPGEAFGWDVGDVRNPAASWRYTLTSEGDGTRLRYRARLGPGESPTRQACLAEPEREHEILAERLGIHRRNMLAVVTGVAELAEKPGPAPV